MFEWGFRGVTRREDIRREEGELGADELTSVGVGGVMNGKEGQRSFLLVKNPKSTHGRTIAPPRRSNLGTRRLRPWRRQLARGRMPRQPERCVAVNVSDHRRPTRSGPVTRTAQG